MAIRINPFHELYVGESVGPDKFVNLFSEVIVKHALSLFQPGHVILKGLPGSGKSMLLNLLKPSIRLAYEKAGQRFPVPAELMKFIGAGINLKRSGISDFGQRTIGDQNELTSPIYFGDFLNYWIVSDIFQSIKKLSNEESLTNKIGIDNDKAKCDQFAEKLSKLDCWLGYLDGVKDLGTLQQKINNRITSYRSFLNYNISNLSDDINNSKSLVGVPISQTVQMLKEFKVIEDNTEVYIRIDQYEELEYLDESTTGVGTSYLGVIHKLLGMRDINVSYRIGSRYWRGDEIMHGSAARLEKKRNYSIVSIDSVFRRPENRRLWAFPEFAEDIFKRRLQLSPYKLSFSAKDSLTAKVFGIRLTPSDTAKRYVPNVPEKAIILEDNWPNSWKKFLSSLSSYNPFSARLGEAWARQKGKEEVVNKKIEEPYPWERDNKKWWKKERTEQALMQIASRNRQQLIWYGRDDLLGLSGGHILIFLSLCQHIWDVWIRDKRNEAVDLEMKLPPLDEIVQSAGIRETSSDWFEDISNVKGGKERKVFINYLGTLFYKNLVEDKAMSYPGRNGFSMKVEDFQKNDIVYDFIIDACEYGDLYDASHTSKSSDKKPRRKFYLNPILSPYFKIPYAHTKEPMYVDVKTVAAWLIDCGIFQKADFSELLNEIKTKDKLHKNGQGVIEFKESE